MSFATIIDRKSSTPIRRQIYEQWRQGILTGRFRPGERVPSTREMAAALDVARSTMSEVWEQLVAEGYLETVHGSGTFVCSELPDEMLTPSHHPHASPETGTGKNGVVLSRYGAALETDFRRPRPAPGVIQFPAGSPAVDHFPFELWRKLLLRHLRKPTTNVFDYAEQSAGLDRLRDAIANYVGRLRAVRCTPEQVIIVNGSQQALDLCARLFVEPSNAVVLENPGYLGARRIFESYGARLRPAPIEEDGIAIRDLKGKARCVYVTPSHQFPTGMSMSLARRLELIKWAHDCGAVIIEDDYCSEYRYSGSPLPSLQSMAGNVPILYVGTFSKVMFPGLRIGYVIAPAPLVARFERAKWLADRHTPLLEQCALADFIIDGHLERHIRRMRRLYGRRREVLLESLRLYFGDRARVFGSNAGMHALVEFADDRVVARANQNKVLLTTADACYMTRPPRGQAILGFAGMGERTIREGVKRLAAYRVR